MFLSLEAVRGKDGSVLYSKRLAAEREVYMDFAIPEVDLKRPFCYDSVEGEPFIFTCVVDRVQIQLKLLTMVLQRGGQLWMLDEL